MTQYLNGQATTQLPILDRGLAYGDGVFETIAITDSQLEFWPEHWQRLRLGLLKLGITATPDVLYRELSTDIKFALAGWTETRGVLKITVTRGLGGRGYLPPENSQPNRIVQISAWPTGREDIPNAGAHLHLCQHAWSQNSALAGLKHLNRLDQVLARQEWRDPNIHEGLMLNQSGGVQSGVMSNVFVESHGVIYTPLNDSAGINGIMAEQVKVIAASMTIEVKQQVFDVNFLKAADGVFLTNSLNGIWPVVRLVGTNFPITSITRDLQAALVSHIATHTRRIEC